MSKSPPDAVYGGHLLHFAGHKIRHARVRMTGLPKGAWASLREFRLVA